MNRALKHFPGGGGFIINWAINKTLKNVPYPYGRFIIVIN